MIACCLLIGQVTADRLVMKKSAQPTPDTSLSNVDCKLASTADSTFESALIGGINADRRRKIQHKPTDCSRPTEITPTSQ